MSRITLKFSTLLNKVNKQLKTVPFDEPSLSIRQTTSNSLQLLISPPMHPCDRLLLYRVQVYAKNPLPTPLELPSDFKTFFISQNFSNSAYEKVLHGTELSVPPRDEVSQFRITLVKNLSIQIPPAHTQYHHGAIYQSIENLKAGLDYIVSVNSVNINGPGPAVIEEVKLESHKNNQHSGAFMNHTL